MNAGLGKTLILVILIVLAFGCISQADDSAMQEVCGGAIQPMDEHPTINMVRETVDVKLGARVGSEWPVFVRCEFEFHNDGKATDVQMGFPEIATAGGDASAEGRLNDFKSWVDDKPAKVVYIVSSKNEKTEYSEKYKAWYTKKVHFDAGQTRRVVNMYSARLGTDETAGGPDGMIFTFGYILRTGANWNGPIKEAVINVDVSAAGTYSDIGAYPKNFTTNGKKFTWVFKNIEPKEDIGLSFKQRLPLLNGKLLNTSYFWEPYFERNGVMMSSLRFIQEQSESNNKGYILKYGKHVLKLQAGSRSAILDGKKIELAHAIWADKDPYYFAVPLEEIVKLLGGSVEYDSNRRPNVILKQIKLRATDVKSGGRTLYYIDED